MSPISALSTERSPSVDHAELKRRAVTCLKEKGELSPKELLQILRTPKESFKFLKEVLSYDKTVGGNSMNLIPKWVRDKLAHELATCPLTVMALKLGTCSDFPEQLREMMDEATAAEDGDLGTGCAKTKQQDTAGEDEQSCFANALSPPVANKPSAADQTMGQGHVGFMTAGGRAIAADQGRRQQAEALLAGCGASQDEQSCFANALSPPVANKPSAADQTMGQGHVGFMTAGGRAIAADLGRRQQAEALLGGCGATAVEQPCLPNAFFPAVDSEECNPIVQSVAAKQRSCVAVPPNIPEHPSEAQELFDALNADLVPGNSPLTATPFTHGASTARLNLEELARVATPQRSQLLVEGKPRGMKRPVKTLALEMPENYNTILPDWINESTSEGGAFQELLTSTEAPVLPVERFTGRWLRIQQAQLALKTAAGDQVASGGPSSLSRLLKRARAELAGYKSAFYRICIGSSAASDHMLLICSATFPRVEGGKKHKRGTEYLAEDATIEVSDGWYFIKAHLDAELSHHLRCGRLRAGQYLHVCGAKATELTEDPLNLGPSARQPGQN
eukprot:symbB.v1.2.003783.t1/scaffold214.1/size264264/5